MLISILLGTLTAYAYHEGDFTALSKGLTSGVKALDFCNILKISQSLVQQVLPVI